MKALKFGSGLVLGMLKSGLANNNITNLNLNNMTTYHQLWWDEEFVRKRMVQQLFYLMKFRIGFVKYPKNAKELSNLDNWIFNPFKTAQVESARLVLDRFERQLEEIQKLKGHCCRY